MREFACARCGMKLASGASPPVALCPRCQFVNTILPSTEPVPVPPALIHEIHLPAGERQVAYPEFAAEKLCQDGLASLGEKDRNALVHLIMGGREGLAEQDLARVRVFRSKGRRDYYWRRVAEFTAKARIRDFLEKTWKHL